MLSHLQSNETFSINSHCKHRNAKFWKEKKSSIHICIYHPNDSSEKSIERDNNGEAIPPLDLCVFTVTRTWLEFCISIPSNSSQSSVRREGSNKKRGKISTTLFLNETIRNFGGRGSYLDRKGGKKKRNKKCISMEREEGHTFSSWRHDIGQLEEEKGRKRRGCRCYIFT